MFNSTTAGQTMAFGITCAAKASTLFAWIKDALKKKTASQIGGPQASHRGWRVKKKLPSCQE